MTNLTPRTAATAMSYTVVPVQRSINPFTGAFQIHPEGGYVATVRRSVHGVNRVVKQFPRFLSQKEAHTVAQGFISSIKRVNCDI